MCLLALAASVKPLADIVANYACCDRHKETGQDCIHSHHLLSVARLEKGSGFNIPTALDSVNAVLLPKGLLLCQRWLPDRAALDDSSWLYYNTTMNYRGGGHSATAANSTPPDQAAWLPATRCPWWPCGRWLLIRLPRIGICRQHS